MIYATETCPACGNYRLARHCATQECPTKWCTRAQCGWENGITHLDQPDGPYDWGQEYVDPEKNMTMPSGIQHPTPKRWLKPIVFIGRGILEDAGPDELIYMVEPGAWMTDPSSRRPQWSQQDADGMYRTINAMVQSGIAFGEWTAK